MKRKRFAEEQIIAVLREHELARRRAIWLASTVSTRRRCRASESRDGPAGAPGPSRSGARSGCSRYQAIFGTQFEPCGPVPIPPIPPTSSIFCTRSP